jgi:hypothetical protein
LAWDNRLDRDGDQHGIKKTWLLIEIKEVH